MKRILLIVLLLTLLYPQATDAQKTKTDSLLLVIEQHDRTRLISAANQLMAFYYKEETSDEPLRFNHHTPSDSIRMYTWYWTSEHYLTHHKYQQSICYSLFALPLCRKSKNQQLLSDCLSVAAIAHFRLGAYEESIKYAIQTLQIDRRLGDKSRISSSLNTIAGIYLAARLPQKAQNYITEALKISREIKDTARIAIQSGMAAEILHAIGNEASNKKALEYARTAYELDMQRGRPDRAAIRLSQLSDALIALGRYNEACMALQVALSELEKVGNRQSLAICHKQLGLIARLTGKPKEAKWQYEKAVDLFTAIGDIRGESKAQHELYLLLKEQHPQQAAIHLQRYSTLKDSLYTRETANRLAANDAEYRAQQLLAESAKERSQHLIHIIVFTLFMVILIATTTFVLLRKRKHKGEDYVAITNHQEQTVDGETQEADEKFAQTLRYEIEQRLTEGMINLEELASAMYMSRGQLNRRVKALTGLTTSSYILSLRLDMACKLLLQFPDKPINEVAQQCGFDNFLYFNRLFKREKGVTPSEYKGSC